MSTVERPHGRAKYSVEKCRCDVCRADNSAYEQQRRRQRAYGRAPYVDAAPVRAHVLRLREIGMGALQVAKVSGVSKSVVKKLLYGDPARGQEPLKRMRPENARRLLAVPVRRGLVADGQQIDITGTRRRIEALVASGWSRQQLCRRLSLPDNYLSRLMLRQPRCTAGLAREVADLYDELWDRPPPETTHAERQSASRARRDAMLHGFAPPLAWDDDSIDDPAAVPDLGAAPLSVVDLGEDEHLRVSGVLDEQIAERMGVTVDGLHLARRRARRRVAS
jgi:hypothetical protein